MICIKLPCAGVLASAVQMYCSQQIIYKEANFKTRKSKYSSVLLALKNIDGTWSSNWFFSFAIKMGVGKSNSAY